MAGETAAVRAALQRIANLDGGAALIMRAGLAARGAVAGAGPSNAPNVGAARGSQAAAEARIAARRQATEAEEEFLQSQERQTQQEEAHLLGLIEADEVDMEDIDVAFDEYVPSEFEDFDQEKELQEYETAQREAELAAEAERAENFAWMQDMADAEPDLDRFRLVEVLRDGAQWLVDDAAFYQASYAQLAQVQYAAQQLLENVQKGLQAAVEIERQAAFEQVARVRAEAAIAAETTRMQMATMKNQLNLLKARETRLQESLEKEKDRTNCKICFTRTKNAVLLPCLHADYCLLCISEHKKRRNTCPTCRTPISGTLECRPAQPDDE